MVPKRSERLKELPHKVRGEIIEVGLLGEDGQAVEGQEIRELVETNHHELMPTGEEGYALMGIHGLK